MEMDGSKKYEWWLIREEKFLEQGRD